MSKYRPPLEIVELATRLVDDELDAEQLERLRQIVAEDQAVAAWLVEWLELNAILHLDLASQNQFPLIPTALLPSAAAPTGHVMRLLRASNARDASDEASFRCQWRTVSTLAAAALLAMVYVLGVFTANRVDRTSTPSADSQPFAVVEKTIATIAGGVAAEFDDGLALGSRVGPGRLQIESWRRSASCSIKVPSSSSKVLLSCSLSTLVLVD